MHWVCWTCRVVEFLRIPKLVDFLHRQTLINTVCKTIWRISTKVEPMSEAETEAAVKVFGPRAIQYDAVRVAEGRLLRLAFWINKDTAFTTLHSINLPKSGGHSRTYLEDGIKKTRLHLMIHELTHVYQFERVGSVYMCQALRAQRSKEGYNFGGWPGLKEDAEEEKHYCDYNREQQASIAENFYRDVVAKEPDVEDKISKAYGPFIEELRKGEFKKYEISNRSDG